MRCIEPKQTWRCGVGELIGERQQVPGDYGLRTIVARNDHSGVRMLVYQELTTPPAWRENSAPFIPDCNDLSDRPRARGGRRAERDHLRARAAREMFDIHPCVDLTVDIHRSCGNRVERIGSVWQPRGDFHRGIEDALFRREEHGDYPTYCREAPRNRSLLPGTDRGASDRKALAHSSPSPDRRRDLGGAGSVESRGGPS